MPGQNAATRLNAFVQRAPTLDAGQSALDALFDLFGLGALPAPAGASLQALPCLSALLDQVKQIDQSLGAAGVPAALWAPALQRLRRALTPDLLTGPWQRLLDEIDPTLAHTLQWAAHVLPADEAEVPAEAIDALQLAIEEVLMLIEQVDLPEPLRDWLNERMGALRRALRIAPLAGLQPLREAISQVAGDLALRRAQLVPDAADLATKAGPTCRQAGAALAQALELANQAAGSIAPAQRLTAGGGVLDLLPA